MTLKDRVDNYNKWLGSECLFFDGSGRIGGTWYIGNNYAKKNDYYGGYQGNYLKRVSALFPDKKSVLHLYAGMADVVDLPGDKMDINPQTDDTIYCDARELSKYCDKKYDLIVADPPYGTDRLKEYGDRYGCSAETINVKKVYNEMFKVATEDCHVVWLDWARPFYKNAEWLEKGAILYRGSTGHKDRSVTIFEKSQNSA